MKCKTVNWYFFCLIFQFSPVNLLRVLSWWKKKISCCYSQYLRLGPTRQWSFPRSYFCLSGVFIPEFKTCRFLWLSKLGLLFNGQKLKLWFVFLKAPFKASNFVFSWRFWALFCRDARLNNRTLAVTTGFIWKYFWFYITLWLYAKPGMPSSRERP